MDKKMLKTIGVVTGMAFLALVMIAIGVFNVIGIVLALGIVMFLIRALWAFLRKASGV